MPKKKKQSLSIFDFINAVTFSKKDLTTHPEFEKLYNPFMMNRWLSMNYSTVYETHFLNRVHNLSKKLHFKFLLNLIEKQRVYIKYQKQGKQEDLEAVKDYYDVDETEARELVNILSKKQLKTIKDSFGGKNSRK